METTISTHDMNKAGRKPLPESKRRSHRITIRLSGGELRQFEALAKKQKASLSESIRYALTQVSV